MLKKLNIKDLIKITYMDIETTETKTKLMVVPPINQLSERSITIQRYLGDKYIFIDYEFIHTVEIFALRKSTPHMFRQYVDFCELI